MNKATPECITYTKKHSGVNYLLKDLWRKYKSYIVGIIIPIAVGGIATLLTMKNMSIMGEIEQPPLTPPPIVFSLVWSALYILMGISSAIVYEGRESDRKAAREGLSYYAASLAVNFVYSIIFFNFRAFFISGIWLLLLIFLIVMTVLYYRKINKVAAYLQIPYAVWVAFATYLTFGINYLNP